MTEVLRRARMASNGLSPRVPGSAADVVRAVCGIQAQHVRAAALSVRVRSEAAAGGGEGGAAAGACLTAADVAADPGIVRTWAWRGTLHLLAREDLGWVLSLVAPRFLRAGSARWRALGLDEPTAERAREILRGALAAGPLTRAEVRAALAEGGVDPTGQRLPHLLSHAALAGDLTCGVGDDTFHALDPKPDRVPKPEALAELARRYTAAYGPADDRDLAAWSGLRRGQVLQHGIGPALESQIGAAPRAGAHESPQGADERVALQDLTLQQEVRLLPAFDTYLLGWRSRSHAVAAEHAKRVWPGGGWIHPVVLVDGVAAGTWKLDGGEVKVDAWDEIPGAGLAAEAASVQRFLGAA